MIEYPYYGRRHYLGLIKQVGLGRAALCPLCSVPGVGHLVEKDDCLLLVGRAMVGVRGAALRREYAARIEPPLGREMNRLAALFDAADQRIAASG